MSAADYPKQIINWLALTLTVKSLSVYWEGLVELEKPERLGTSGELLEEKKVLRELGSVIMLADDRHFTSL